jgi:hypothetical protein
MDDMVTAVKIYKKAVENNIGTYYRVPEVLSLILAIYHVIKSQEQH